MENKVYGRPSSLNDKVNTYCPGCGHGVIQRLLAETIDEMGIAGNTIGVCYVGCGGMIYDFFNIDFAFPLHGRSPAVATGIKRVRPDKIVIGYQGDGDLAAIGTTEIIHAATDGAYHADRTESRHLHSWERFRIPWETYSYGGDAFAAGRSLLCRTGDHRYAGSYPRN